MIRNVPCMSLHYRVFCIKNIRAGKEYFPAQFDFNFRIVPRDEEGGFL